MTDRTPWLSRLAQRWYERRTFSSTDLPSGEELASIKRGEDLTVSVVLPALNEESTVGGIARSIRRYLMGRDGLVDELLVIDANSTDRTALVARAAGARVVSLSELLPEITPERGKGESLWRSLVATRGDLVVWIDADIRNFGPHFVERLVAPLVLDQDTTFVKGFYRRPIAHGEELLPSGGGRVTELLARPLLNAFFPELAGLVQPLSGEYAGRRDALVSLPFFTGYSVEVGLLIDLLESEGLDAIAQVDLDERIHRNRPLNELGPMAYAIARTIVRRAEEWGRLKAAFDYPNLPLIMPDGERGLDIREVRELERPPMRLLLASLRELNVPGGSSTADGAAASAVL